MELKDVRCPECGSKAKYWRERSRDYKCRACPTVFSLKEGKDGFSVKTVSIDYEEPKDETK